MKNTFLFLITMIALLPATNAQSINSYTLATSCQNWIFRINLSAAGSNLSATTYWGDGQSTTTTIGASQTNVQFSHTYATAGTYTLKSVLFKNTIPLDTLTVSYGSYCSHVILQSYMDNNSNCTMDSLERLASANVQVEVDSAGTVVDTITVFGITNYKAAGSTVYKFRELNTPLGTALTCPSGGVITITTPATGFGGYAWFGHLCNNTTLFDLGVHMYGMFRPVNNSRLYILAYNSGCGAKSGIVTLNLSNKYKYKSANPAPASVTGQIITWTVNNLSNTDAALIELVADTATTVGINDTVCNTVTITPNTGDANPSNNTLFRCDPVRAAWDPNDKSVTPSGDILPGTALTYTINFENLGNDTAFNIHILDTLSENLDIASFEIISSSHPVNHHFFTDIANRNILKFEFADIYLADKSSPGSNKGFVQFSIKAKNNLPYHTQINNRAGIYFDINPVVLTNYAENRIAAPENIGKVNVNSNLTIYPNPVTDVLTIKIEAGVYETVKLINNIGQVIMHSSLTGTVTQIDMQQLPTGLYYLQVIGKAGSVSHKVEKL